MLKSFSFRYLFLAFFFFFFIFSGFSFAKNNEIECRLSPSYPSAYEPFEVNLSSNYFNLDSAEVSFYVDNVLIKKGFGLRKFDFYTLGIGRKINIRVEVKKNSGEIEKKELVVNPAEVSLVYQVVEPHRPFGYLGKSVALSDSQLNIYAFTNFLDNNGKEINSEELIYEWYLNYEYNRSVSGVGRDIFKIARLHANPRETDVTVKVLSRDRKIIAKKNIHFAPQRTTIDFYLLDDVLPFNFKNVANPSLKSRDLDTKILAVPYFMNYVPDNVQISWKLNGKSALSLLNNPLQIILSNSVERFVENINVFLRIKNQDRVLQSVQRDFLVEFSGEDSDVADEDTVFYNKRKSNIFGESDSFWPF